MSRSLITHYTIGMLYLLELVITDQFYRYSFFKLNYWFTVLCYFKYSLVVLVSSGVTQLHMYMYIHIYFHFIFHYRLLEDINYIDILNCWNISCKCCGHLRILSRSQHKRTEALMTFAQIPKDILKRLGNVRTLCSTQSFSVRLFEWIFPLYFLSIKSIL